ncbi:MAG: hopanoid biosynthesis associated radical SAM protein HpnJ [Candidatus Brocadiales bacterium]|nr:hopanoid biosynthesis associated radical SAM protein HpnJ [Candidatus Bathyanammoxibius amoris]
MKVALLNPPTYEDFDGGAGSRYHARREVTSFWYPTWLCYPAGMIPESRVIDAPAERLDFEQTLHILKDFDFVAMYTTAASAPVDNKTAAAIKAAYKDVKIAFLGPHVSILPEETLRASNAVDFVCRREFDYTLKEFAEGKPLGEIDGVSYRSNGDIIHNKDRKFIEDLDALPFVVDVYKRDLHFRNYTIPYLRDPYVSIYTGRGCPGQCTYCLWPQTFTGNTYRVRSADNVIEEVKLAVKYFPEAGELFFDDDTFTADKARAREIARKLKPLGITWSCSTRASVDYETMKIMKDSGLRLLLTGYESGNREILKKIKKGVTLEQAEEFAKNCKKLGIMSHGAFVLGLPEETPETVEESIRFACKIDPDTIQVSLASPYPGTELYDYCKDRGYLVEDNLVSERGYQKCSVQYPRMSSEEIYKALDRFYWKFYFRPKYIAKTLWRMLRDKGEAKRLLKEGYEFFQFTIRRKAAGKDCKAC